jgi:lysophospholipase L1-like esterase
MNRRFHCQALRCLTKNTRSYVRAPSIGLKALLRAITISASVNLLAIFLTPFSLAKGLGDKWVATWASAMQGTLIVAPAPPYGDTPASIYGQQPDLTFAFPYGTNSGAVDQTIRLIVKPDLWGRWVRLRFSNFFGCQPVTFSDVRIALQSYSANLTPSTNTQVTFGGKSSVIIKAGDRIFSDPVQLPLTIQRNPSLLGLNLAVSIAVQGQSGPITYHADSFTTSYISPSGSGDHTADLSGENYPYSTSSWFFLDAIDVLAPADTVVICALGDSITDGEFSTLNADDRWANALFDRLHRIYGDHVSLVNEGIGGNTVVNPPQIGPAAVDRLKRDVLSLSGLTTVIWLEGINDFGGSNNTVSAVIAGLTEGVRRMHAKGLKVIGATITSSLGYSLDSTTGTPATDAKRQATNAFIRNSGIYDGVADFDAVTIDHTTGQLSPEFVPDSTKGGPGDMLHPNRAGYQAMANSVNAGEILPQQ